MCERSDATRMCVLCSGPMLALCLAREDAVSGWRDKLGPTELQEAKETQPEWYISKFPTPQVHLVLASQDLYTEVCTSWREEANRTVFPPLLIHTTFILCV